MRDNFENRKPSEDVYTRVTNQIVEAIEAGAGIYKMPWHFTSNSISAPINAVTRKPYRGVNILSLWATSMTGEYTSGIWATYSQWKELGTQVRKGEKSTVVVFWQFINKPGAEEIQ